MLILAHLLSLVVTKLLTLHVPTPFVDLGLGQGGSLSDSQKGLFRPVRIGFKLLIEKPELVLSLPHALTNDTLHLASLWVQHVASPLAIEVVHVDVGA